MLPPYFRHVYHSKFFISLYELLTSLFQNGKTKLVNIKNQDTMTKILDMIPDAIDKFSSGKDEKMTEQDVADILDGESKEV